MHCAFRTGTLRWTRLGQPSNSQSCSCCLQFFAQLARFVQRGPLADRPTLEVINLARMHGPRLHAVTPSQLDGFLVQICMLLNFHVRRSGRPRGCDRQVMPLPRWLRVVGCSGFDSTGAASSRRRLSGPRAYRSSGPVLRAGRSPSAGQARLAVATSADALRSRCNRLPEWARQPGRNSQASATR